MFALFHFQPANCKSLMKSVVSTSNLEVVVVYVACPITSLAFSIGKNGRTMPSFLMLKLVRGAVQNDIVVAVEHKTLLTCGINFLQGFYTVFGDLDLYWRSHKLGCASVIAHHPMSLWVSEKMLYHCLPVPHLCTTQWVVHQSLSKGIALNLHGSLWPLCHYLTDPGLSSAASVKRAYSAQLRHKAPKPQANTVLDQVLISRIEPFSRSAQYKWQQQNDSNFWWQE